MFSFFKRDPAKRLQSEYERKLTEARDLQRKGDIKGCARASGEADELLKRIESVESSGQG